LANPRQDIVASAVLRGARRVAAAIFAHERAVSVRVLAERMAPAPFFADCETKLFSISGAASPDSDIARVIVRCSPSLMLIPQGCRQQWPELPQT